MKILFFFFIILGTPLVAQQLTVSLDLKAPDCSSEAILKRAGLSDKLIKQIQNTPADRSAGYELSQIKKRAYNRKTINYIPVYLQQSDYIDIEVTNPVSFPENYTIRRFNNTIQINKNY